MTIRHIVFAGVSLVALALVPSMAEATPASTVPSAPVNGAAISPASVKVGSAPTMTGIVVDGHSIAKGLGVALQNLVSGVTVAAVPGQSPFQIGVREGAIDTTVTATGGTIGNPGGEVVTFPLGYEPLTTNGPIGGVTGTVAGVNKHGRITLSGTTYTFTADNTSSPVPLPNPVQFIVDKVYQNAKTKVFMIDHNTSQQSQQSIQTVVERILANTPAAAQIIFAPDPYDEGSASLIPAGNFGLLTTQNNAHIKTAVQAAGGLYVDTNLAMWNAYNPSFAPDAANHANGSATTPTEPPSQRLLDGVGVTTSAVSNSATSIPYNITTGTIAAGDLLVLEEGSNAESMPISAVTASTGAGTATVSRGCSICSSALAHSSGVVVDVVNALHSGGVAGSDGDFIANHAAYQAAFPSANHLGGYDIMAATVQASMAANPAPAPTPPNLSAASDGALSMSGAIAPNGLTAVGSVNAPLQGVSTRELNIVGTGYLGNGGGYLANLVVNTLCVNPTPASATNTCWLSASVVGSTNYLLPSGTVFLGSSSSPFSYADLANLSFYAASIYPDTASAGSVGTSSKPFGTGYINTLNATTINATTVNAANYVYGTQTNQNSTTLTTQQLYVQTAAGTTFFECLVLSSTNYCVPAPSTNVTLGTSSQSFFAADLGHLGFYDYVVNPDTADYGSVGTSSLPFGSVYANTQHAAGATFTVSGSGASSPVGGGDAGTFVAGTSGTNTVTITLAGGNTNGTAAHGWICGDFSDLITNADTSSWQEISSTTTTATFKGTAVANDIIEFACPRGY